jgi:uncharacterized membrane protein
MSLDIIKMIKKVSLYDMIIGILIAILISIKFTSFVVPLLVGLIVAIINFALSSTITDLLMNKKEGRYMPLYLLSFIFRIAIISVIGYVFFAQNNYNVLAYAGGYTINLISVSLYSMTKK